MRELDASDILQAKKFINKAFEKTPGQRAAEDLYQCGYTSAQLLKCSSKFKEIADPHVNQTFNALRTMEIKAQKKT